MSFYRSILNHPWLVVAGIAVITIFFGWKARDVRLDPSLEAVLPEGHPAVLQDHEIKQIFESREMILIGILRDDGIFHSSTLRKVQDLTKAIWRLSVATPGDVRALARWQRRLGPSYADRIEAIVQDGLDASDRGPVNNLWLDARDDPAVDEEFRTFLKTLRTELSPVSDVISLAEVDDITASSSGLDVGPPMDKVPVSPQGLQDLAHRVFQNDMFVDGLVSEDSTGTLILVELSFYYDDHLDVAHRLFASLEALAAPYRGPEDIRLAGVPMVNVYTSDYMSGDLTRLMPLVILVVLVVMYGSFRSVRAALLPLIVVLVALVWTLGVMAMAGRPITLIVTAMPVILIAIGVADGIHLITEYQLMWAQHSDRDEAILTTMRALTRPVIFTSLTDVAGFGSLAISSIASIRDFGIFTSIGVLAALVFSLTVIPAVLKLTPPPQRVRVRSGKRFAGLLERLERFALRRRPYVIGGTLVLAVAAALVLPRIRVGGRMVGYFHKDSAIYQASQMINARFGGTEVLNVVVDTGRPDGLKDPEVLATIAALQDTLEQQALVGYTTSLADYVRRINLVMHDDDPAYNRIPADSERVMETDWEDVNGREVAVERPVEVPGRDVIAQYLLLYENAGGDNLSKLADYDYRKANIIAQIRTDHTPMLRKIRQVAIDFSQRAFGSDAHVTFAGCSNLCIVADDLIIPSQLESLGLALVVVMILLVFTYRSVRRGLQGLAPLVLTILLVFATLAVFGIYLDAVTALIASIVLGIGIDYSVHFLSRYQVLRQEGMGAAAAIHETMETSGRAIIFNSLAVALGFLVLLFSSFWPVQHIGWMVAASMVLAAFFTLLLVPALLGREETSERSTGETSTVSSPSDSTV